MTKNINNFLSQQKKSIIILISILLVFVGISGYLVYTGKAKLPFVKKQSNSNATADDIVNKLGRSLEQVNLDTVLYDNISFKELPVYPVGWVERFFTNSEQANQLISAPNADADSDGLTNKEEYFYASNPKNKDTLCEGKRDDKTCFGKTDKENVDSGLSPLTGLTLDSFDKIKIKKQDYAILNRIQDSFENASKEGVDFPTLYQLSKTIDLSSEYGKISILTQSNDRVNIVNYITFRATLLQDIADQGEVTLFSEVYKSIKIEEIKATRKKYSDKTEELKNTYTPERFAELHKAYIYFFEKVVQLLDLRVEGISEKKIESKEFRDRSKVQGTQVMWAYRKLSEISSNLKVDLNGEK
jgi:hypothetical protein